MITVLMFPQSSIVAAGEAAAGDTLRLTLPSDPHTLLPILQISAEEQAVASLSFDALFEFDDRNEVHAELASDIPTYANHGISKDGKTITVHVRRDVKWHDGHGLDAADVVYTIRQVLDPANEIANRSYFINIEKIEATESHTVVFHLRRPQGSFLATVGTIYPIVPAHLLQGSRNLATDEFNSKPIGSGPYRFVRWIRGDRLEFAANPEYFRGPPKIARIVVSIVPDQNTLAIQLRQGLLDFAMVGSATYAALGNDTELARKIEPLSDFIAYAMNETSPLLSDPRIRLALIKAVDRERLVQTVTLGLATPAYGDLPLFMYGGRPPQGWSVADVAQARRLLDSAGWKVTADGTRVKDEVPLRLNLIGDSVASSSLALQVQQMLAAVGVQVVYKGYASSLYYAPASSGGPLTGGKYDLAFISFLNGSDTSDAVLYSCSSRLPAGSNFSNYCSSRMDLLLEEAERAYEPVQHNRIIARIQDLAAADAIYMFLYHTPYRFVMSTKLHRSSASLTNRWFDVRNWTFGP